MFHPIANHRSPGRSCVTDSTLGPSERLCEVGLDLATRLDLYEYAGGTSHLEDVIEVPAFAAQLGTRVRHQTWWGDGFGEGTVVALGTYKGVASAAVRFDNGDQKLLAEPYAPLRAI